MTHTNISWERVEDILCNQTYYLGGKALSRNDCCRVANAYTIYAIMYVDTRSKLTELLESGSYDTTKISAGLAHINDIMSDMNICNMCKELGRADVADVISQLKSALLVARHITDSNVRHLDGMYRLFATFGYDRAVRSNTMLNWLLHALCLCQTAELFDVFNSLVQSVTRLTLRDVDWIEEDNIQKYKDFEISLHDIASTYDVDADYLLDTMNTIVKGWFADFDITDNKGLHGYGATADVKRSQGTAAKYSKMRIDTYTARAAKLLDWYPSEFSWPGLREAIDRLSIGPLTGPSIHRQSRVNLVPKGIDKKRVISMEDTTNQFFQKTLFVALDNHFRKHPEMRIDLHRQEHNRKLALIGSRTRYFGTADLSSASDSVSWTIVKRVFKGTKLLRALFYLRTRETVLPDNTVVQMEKAFPMGSAVCFPIECVVFSAAVAAANVMQGKHSHYRVYGDDLVIPRPIWHCALNNLAVLGFIVNDDKSYAPGSKFTESCGIECWNGSDVSPLRLSRKWDVIAQRKDSLMKDILAKKIRRYTERHKSSVVCGLSTQYSAIVEFANQCYDKGYMTLRRFIIQQCRRYYPLVCYSHKRECGILSKEAMLRHDFWIIARDCNNELQYMPVVARMKSRTEKASDIVRLSKLLEDYDTLDRDTLLYPEDRRDVKCGTATTNVEFVAVPYSTLSDMSEYG